jgi:hypothetical protein
MAFEIERQEFTTYCEHANGPRGCRAYWDRVAGAWMHDVKAWHVWDTDRDDYAAGTGPGQFTTRRDAAAWVEKHSTTD